MNIDHLASSLDQEFRNEFIGTPLQFQEQAFYWGASTTNLRRILYTHTNLSWGDGKLIEISLNNSCKLSLQSISIPEQRIDNFAIPPKSVVIKNNLIEVNWLLPRAQPDDFNQCFRNFLAVQPNLTKRLKSIISPKGLKLFLDGGREIVYLQGLAIESLLLESTQTALA